MNEDKVLVSFILTYYNLPVELLRQSIDSILRLTLRPYEREIIVVDDGSDRSPMNDLLAYGPDIIYIRKQNGGLSTARNLGMEMARGQFIQFVDADDQLIQAPYEHCLDIVRYDKAADMVLFDFTRQLGTPSSIADDPQPTSGTDYMRHNNLHGTAWGYLFRKAIAGELRFTPGIYHEDEEFTPQLMLRAEKVWPTRVKAYYYNSRQDSITTRSDQAEKRMADSLYVISSLARIADRLPHNDQLAMERRVAQLAMDYIYKAIMERRPEEWTRQRLDELKQLGLYPLPDRDYTAKYRWFRKLTTSPSGLTLLTRLLPLMKKEK